MRHGNKINHLGRKTAHRKALLMNLSNALIAHKRITTTVAKAKVLRQHIEPLLNKTKLDTTHNRRILFSYLQDKESIKELFGVIADKIANRPGGYTRIIKLGFRKGDAADIAMIELVDFNDTYKPNEVKDTTVKTRRSRAKKSDSQESTVSPAKDAITTNDLIEDIESTEVLVDNNSQEELIIDANNSGDNIPADVVEEVVNVADEIADTETKDEEVIEITSETEKLVEAEEAPKTLEIKTKDGADDLKVIEGIGPKIEELLHAKDIKTFAQLSETSVDTIKEILAEGGSKYTMHDPSTWPQQSQLLVEGKFEEFQKLCEELDGGKKVD